MATHPIIAYPCQTERKAMVAHVVARVVTRWSYNLLLTRCIMAYPCYPSLSCILMYVAPVSNGYIQWNSLWTFNLFIYVSKKYNKNISWYHIFVISLLHVLSLIQATGKTVNNDSFINLGNILMNIAMNIANYKKQQKQHHQIHSSKMALSR